MEIRELLVDIILVVIMVVSTLVLMLRLWQDLTIAIATTLLMLSLGGLFLSLHIRVRNLEKLVMNRERGIRTNVQEIADRMSAKYDRTMAHMDEVVEALSKRVYR